MPIVMALYRAVEPVITTTPEEVLVVDEGSPASLECSIVSGTPTPEVKWVRKDMEEEEIVGSTLAFSTVTRQHAGYYLCLANNGFGPSPVMKEVRLVVQCEEFLSRKKSDSIIFSSRCT